MPDNTAAVAPENFCRSWPADFKLAAALLVILVVGWLSPEQWPATMTLGVVVLFGHACAGTSLTWMIQRAAAWGVMLLLMAIALWWSQPSSAAGLWLWSWLLRCGVAVLAGLWLMQVFTVQELLSTLRRWHLPGLLIVMVSFLLRYLVVLWEEHGRLQRAQLARGAGSATRWQRWNLALERLGLLLLRSLDRSERIHRAMLSRGWDGSPRGLE